MTVTLVSRRDFVATTGMLTAGLVLGVRLTPAQTARSTPAVTSFAPNAFLQLQSDGTITVWISRAEMGQGVLTTMAMLVAEELEVEWSSIRVARSETRTVYGRHQ